MTAGARPTAILVAGANGAGKTTFARQFLPLLHPGVPFMNADEIQRESSEFAAPIAASRELLRRISAEELSKADFAVETTLSSRTYIGRVKRWKASGYHTVLHFIEVPSADFAVARVRARVASGGHDIPEPDIRRRFERGTTLFADVYQSLVHSWFLWASDANGLRFVRRNA